MIQLQVEQSPVWELILGISGFTHSKLRHTFEMDDEWKTDIELMPPSLVIALKEIEETNFWYGMILLQNQLSAESVEHFSASLSAISSKEYYDWLLPYYSRQSETLRNKLVENPTDLDLWSDYANLFAGHDYLEDYVHQLHLFSQKDSIKLMTRVLSEWEKWVVQKESWDKWIQALSFEQKQHFDLSNPISEIKRITDGVEYIPEPSVLSVKLVPHISYRPWVLTIRTSNTKLFFYPLKEELLLEPGIPSQELVRGHKALGDELRLKLLFQLKESPLSLQELSIRFNISKTTLHHQLALLKAAKFIQVDRGEYSINPEKLRSFSDKLMHYMRDGS